MSIHDWTRVSAGMWHDFHVAWITELRNSLNDGLLPSEHYAQVERAEVLLPNGDVNAEMNDYLLKRRTIAIRHTIDDDIHARINHLPPTPSDPGEPLTLVAYSSGKRKLGYLEPTAVGRTLVDLPLFLTSETYINLPLETTHQAAFRGVPRKWREVLEAAPGT